MSTDKNAKIELWERKLLDLSLRNSLINMKLSSKMIPLFVPSSEELEDKLSEELDFVIRSRSDVDKKTKEKAKEQKTTEEQTTEEPKTTEETKPEETPKTEAEILEEKAADEYIDAGEYTFENMQDISKFENIVKDGFSKKKLYSALTKAELETTVKTLYRSAKTSLEENGANTLYLAMGVIKWIEPAKNAAHYAPILLMPVDLVRKTIALGYVIRRRDEEVQLNVTIMEKLKQDFGINIDELKELPTDASGVDVKKVFDIFRENIEGQEGWEIYNTCCLGMFSFSQFVMWNDLKSRHEALAQNKIVNSLMEGKVMWDFEPMVETGKVDETGVYLPITADASQLYAIKAATRGESFVLHGPPGTGKSQTITSMIADALAHGKTVLFAAEKKAALDVVYKRLEKIGLAPFCLELHSNKAKKSYVLEQLKTACELVKPGAKENYKEALENLDARRHELDQYVDALHNVLPSGYTLYELINIYTENKDANDIPKFDDVFYSDFHENQNKEIEIYIGEMDAAGKELGDTTILNFVGATEYSQKLKADAPELNKEFKEATDKLIAKYQDAKNAINKAGLDYKDDFASINNTKVIAANFIKWFDLPDKWAEAPELETYLNSFVPYLEHYEKSEALKAEINKSWGEKFLEQDGELLLAQLEQAEKKNALMKGFAINSVYKNVKALDKTGNGKNNLKKSFQNLVDYRIESKQMEAVKPDYLPDGYAKDIPGFKKKAELAKALSEELHKFDRTDKLRTTLAGDTNYQTIWETFQGTYDEFETKRNNLFDALNIDKSLSELDREKNISEELDKNIDKLRERIALNQTLVNLKNAGCTNLADAFNNGMSEEDVIRAMKKSYAKHFAALAIDDDATLRGFNGAVFNEKIDAFKKLNEEFMALTKQEVYLRVAATLPDVAKEARASSALGILQHAIKSGGRGVSLRTLFSQIPDMITKLCPCVLMSPISVAQYLEPGASIKFDTVIFDEASQLPTCKAVGVLARGENAIIVGDPNQMPPTSFFSSQNVDDDDYENEDLESILDDCLALSMPQTHLLWHYRSRHESLITFSNKCFYDNKLFTLPSVNDREAKVTLVKVGGIFDRGKTRTNRQEAEAVVEEIIKRSEDKQSVGVVTFNISQQNLIDDLLAEKCKNNPKLEEWAYNSEEPLFIKNLENVQGDERDVILFSVGYGQDETGKTYMNFGPLSSDGGWRRLNVAVTRSRTEMVVFSSLEPEQIKISEDTPRGVASFRRFLEYAEGRTTWDQDSGAASVENHNPIIDRDKNFKAIQREICAELEKLGYDTDTEIGKSQYKVDIGVVDKENPDNYSLGILLDGPFYRDSQTTSGREIYQRSILEGLGWRTMRVWSIDWWENKDKVVASIIERINSNPTPPEPKQEEPADESSEDDSTQQITQQTAQQETQKTNKPRTNLYRKAVFDQQEMSNDDFMSPANTKNLAFMVKEIVDTESPVTADTVTTRLTEALGIKRLTAKTRERVDYLLKYNRTTSTIEGEKVFYWATGVSPDTYTTYRVQTPDLKLEPENISVTEASNAISEALEEQFGMPKEDAMVEGARKLGIPRMTPTAKKLMEQAFDDGIEKEKFKIDSRGWAVVIS